MRSVNSGTSCICAGVPIEASPYGLTRHTCTTSVALGKQVLNFDREVRQDAGDAARSDPIGGHLGEVSVRPSDNHVVSNGGLVENHVPLNVVALNSVFYAKRRASGRHPYASFQGTREHFDVQPLQNPCLVGRLHALDVAVSQGRGEGVP